MNPSMVANAAIPDRYDSRDYKWHEVGFGLPPFDWQRGYDVETELQAAFKLPNFRLTPKDQDGSGSCGGQAWATYAAVIEGIATKSYEERSAKYVYAQTFVPGGGSRGRDNAEVYRTQGIAREAILTSYDGGNPPSEAFMERSIDITQAVRVDALLDRSLSYASVPYDIDTIAQSVQACHGVILGITGSNNGTWNSTNPLPPKQGDTFWYHWIYAGKARVSNGVKYIGCLNSWGTAAGDAGWQWLSEDYLKASASIFGSCWTHLFRSDTPSPTYQHTFNVDLQHGNTGPEVVALQTVLQISGEFPASIPPSNFGFYGDITQRSVEAFQRRYNIVTSGTPSTTGYGRVGVRTRARLNAIFGYN